MEIGEFEVTSGKLILIDPCYEKDGMCQINNLKAKKGKWVAHIEHSDEGDWGQRVAKIYAVNKELADSLYAFETDAERIDGDVGVDSGQAGIFDQERYPDDPRTSDQEKVFYKVVCDLTTHGGGVIDFGCVSSSGYGDGGYEAFGTKIGDEFVFVEIVFLEKK